MVYAWLVKHTDASKIAELDAELIDLLPWEDSNSEAAAELEGASFMEMAALNQGD